MITRFRIRGETGAVVDCTFVVHVDGAITVEFDDGRTEAKKPAATKPKTAPRLVVARKDEVVAAVKVDSINEAVDDLSVAVDAAADAAYADATGPRPVKPEPTPDTTAPDDDPFNLADKPAPDEATAKKTKDYLAIECQAMEKRLTLSERGDARKAASVAGLDKSIHRRWKAADLLAVHAELTAAVTALVVPDEPTQDKPADERTSLIDAITPLEADVSERQYSELRELMGIDSGPDALHTTELGNLKELLRRLKDNAGSPAPEPSTSHDEAPV